MAKTKRDIIRGALEELGIVKLDFDAAPEDWALALSRLDEMVSGWKHDRGLDIGWPDGDSDLDQTIPRVDPGIHRVLRLNLAVDIAPPFGKEPLAATIRSAAEALKLLIMQQGLAEHGVPIRGRVSGWPVGAGNYPTPWNRRFLPSETDSEPPAGSPIPDPAPDPDPTPAPGSQIIYAYFGVLPASQGNIWDDFAAEPLADLSAVDEGVKQYEVQADVPAGESLGILTAQELAITSIVDNVIGQDLMSIFSDVRDIRTITDSGGTNRQYDLLYFTNGKSYPIALDATITHGSAPNA